ncbi:Hypothetical predicted protein, partial [Mytilus galloprovincialis]
MKETEKIKEDEFKLRELKMKERLKMDKKEKEDEFKLKELEMREWLEMAKMKIEMERNQHLSPTPRMKNERDNKPKSSAFTTPYITSTLECPASQAFKSIFCDYMEEYKSFMFDGEPLVDVKLPEDDAELYPAYVVTRTMARKQQDEDLQENQFDYMDLSDTFLADIECPGSSEKAITRPPNVNKNVIMPWTDVNSHLLNRKNLFEEQNKNPE